jgi:hypothetical protein
MCRYSRKRAAVAEISRQRSRGAARGIAAGIGKAATHSNSAATAEIGTGIAHRAAKGNGIAAGIGQGAAGIDGKGSQGRRVDIQCHVMGVSDGGAVSGKRNTASTLRPG